MPPEKRAHKSTPSRIFRIQRKPETNEDMYSERRDIGKTRESGSEDSVAAPESIAASIRDIAREIRALLIAERNNLAKLKLSLS